MRAKGFSQIGPALLLSAVLIAGSASAYDAYDSNNCNGVDWDDKRALVVSKVTAHPRVNFIKSPYDDDFKATACPAATAVCRKKSPTWLWATSCSLARRKAISTASPTNRH